jgi:3-deoxy-D-manno-octulosonic-acid transferase
MGETKALAPIIEVLQASAQEQEAVNISVITHTGYQEAQKYNAEVRYLPFELFLPFWIKRQKALVVMEAELWYALFLFAKKRGARTFLINARISERSYPKYLKTKFLYEKIFSRIDHIFAQSQTDKERLESLGAKNVTVLGNIKLAKLPEVTKTIDKKQSRLITAASTHENEEQLIIQAFYDVYLKAKRTDTRLIVVPRHPERFDAVYALIESLAKEYRFSYQRYSHDQDLHSDIVLVDVMGELNNFYAVSDTVILGGAFESIGGHNPIEPAYFNVKLISGKNIYNQIALFECIENYYLIDEEELESYLQKDDALEAAQITAKPADINKIVSTIH